MTDCPTKRPASGVPRSTREYISRTSRLPFIPLLEWKSCTSNSLCKIRITLTSATKMTSQNYPREGAIPGTVDLTTTEGEASSASYGQALYPVPTDDPNDPLLVVTPSHSLSSIPFPAKHANSAGAGDSVAKMEENLHPCYRLHLLLPRQLLPRRTIRVH